MQYDQPVRARDTAFLEFASPDAPALQATLERLGFRDAGKHKSKAITWLRQGGVNLLLNAEPGSHAMHFAKAHGPSCAGMAFLVDDGAAAIATALQREARAADHAGESLVPARALRGIGESALYLVDTADVDALKAQFNLRDTGDADKPFLRIDHVTHCVKVGGMTEWVEFYKRIFGFDEVFKFVAGTKENGFDTIAVRDPHNGACVTVVEPMGAKSQIQEFLDEYSGEGIQHIALSSGDLYGTVERLTNAGIEFLPTPAAYYDALDARLPGHGEDIPRLKKLNMLMDGANTGENPDARAKLLLQIFTKKMVGPIFFEAIQRKGDTSFGEGNAKALFEAIKREQEQAG